MGDEFGNAPRVVDLGDPFGQWSEHLAVVDLLEALAIGLLERDLAHEQQHRRAVLVGDMDSDGAVAGAGAAGDHRRGGATLQLAVGFGHVHRTGFEATGHHLDPVLHVVKAVQHVEIALARHVENDVDPLRHQRIGKDPAAAALRAGMLLCC